MAIDSFFLSLLVQVVAKRRSTLAAPRRLTALALAYPDMLVPSPVVERLLGASTATPAFVESDQAAKIWEWHAMPGAVPPLYETLSVFSALGIDATVIDIAQARGMERIVDLNEPLPDDLCRSFDLVIDTGTLEHCFNVGVAFRNACEALRQDGLLVHGSPLNHVNHGFWNFNPTIYPDYFGDNGFDLQLMTGVAGNPRQGFKPFEVKPFERFEAPPEAGIYVVAQRKRLQDLVWPVQRKYRAVTA